MSSGVPKSAPLTIDDLDSMQAIVLDSEGVTLMSERPVPRSALAFGLECAVMWPVRKWRDATDAEASPLDIHTVTAHFEQYRGDGVAIFRRTEP